MGSGTTLTFLRLHAIRSHVPFLETVSSWGNHFNKQYALVCVPDYLKEMVTDNISLVSPVARGKKLRGSVGLLPRTVRLKATVLASGYHGSTYLSLPTFPSIHNGGTGGFVQCRSLNYFGVCVGLKSAVPLFNVHLLATSHALLLGSYDDVLLCMSSATLQPTSQPSCLVPCEVASRLKASPWR